MTGKSGENSSGSDSTDLSKDQKVENRSDTDFCKLGIERFLVGKEILFDIYVRIHEGRYVKIAREGEAIPFDRLKSYQMKGLNFLYLLKDDFKKYVGFTVNLASAAQANASIDTQKKNKLLNEAAQLVLQKLHLEGVHEDVFEDSRTMLQAILAVVTDAKEILDLLDLIQGHNKFLYAHSLGVALHSCMLAKMVDWQSSQVSFKVTVGGLLHDIGKKDLPASLLGRSKTELNSEETKLMESHPLRGGEMLSKFSFIPSDVIQIVIQHHENSSGLGYPAKMKGRLIHPLTRLVSAANEFCHLTVPDYEGAVVMTPNEAVLRMIAIHRDILDPIFILGLGQLFGVTIPQEFEYLVKKRKSFSA